MSISLNWQQYVTIFQRKLMTEHAFAKAILEDAVRTAGNDSVKLTVDEELLERTRELAKNISQKLPITRVITDVVLEMAQVGDIEFTSEPNETKGEMFGPKILMDVMNLETSLQATQAQQDVSRRVGKATDPRQNI